MKKEILEILNNELESKSYRDDILSFASDVIDFHEKERRTRINSNIKQNHEKETKRTKTNNHTKKTQ